MGISDSTPTVTTLWSTCTHTVARLCSLLWSPWSSSALRAIAPELIASPSPPTMCGIQWTGR